MEEDQIYQLSRKAIEPVVGIIAEKLFNVELEQTSDVEDRAYKIDLKTNDLSFNIQVKTVKAINNHYWYKLEKEIENNTYIAFSKAPLNDDIIDSLGLLYNNTLDELSAGQPQYTISMEEERVYLHPAFGIGQMSFQTYWGYDTPEYVEFDNVDIVCKFISYRFIESIIQARDGVKFDADFQISTDALQKRLEKLKEETDSLKNHAVLSQGLWA